MNALQKELIREIEHAKELILLFSRLGEAGRTADKISDMILFHKTVKGNGIKSYEPV